MQHHKFNKNDKDLCSKWLEDYTSLRWPLCKVPHIETNGATAGIKQKANVQCRVLYQSPCCNRENVNVPRIFITSTLIDVCQHCDSDKAGLCAQWELPSVWLFECKFVEAPISSFRKYEKRKILTESKQFSVGKVCRSSYDVSAKGILGLIKTIQKHQTSWCLWT